MTAGQESNRVRQHVVYYGRVQGVFFRATCFDLSRSFRVVGYVRNLLDGTVELEAEGDALEIDRFLAAIANHFEHNITDAPTSDVPPRGDENDFRIQY